MTPSSLQRLTDCFLSTQNAGSHSSASRCWWASLLSQRSLFGAWHGENLPHQGTHSPCRTSLMQQEQPLVRGELPSWFWFWPKQVPHPENHLVPGCWLRTDHFVLDSEEKGVLSGVQPLPCTSLSPLAGISPLLTIWKLYGISKSQGALGCSLSLGCFLATCYQLLHHLICFPVLQITLRPHFCISSPIQMPIPQVSEYTNSVQLWKTTFRSWRNLSFRKGKEDFHVQW